MKRKSIWRACSLALLMFGACAGELGSPEAVGDVESLIWSGAAGAPALAAATAAPFVISTALRLDKTSVVPGDTVNATVTYANTSTAPITIKAITIAGRRPGATHSGGPYEDFAPSRGATTVAAGAKVTVQASRKLSSTDVTGKWESYATYQDSSGVWHDGPSVFFTLSAATPTPTSGAMSIGTNFWYHADWSGEQSMKSGINWATAYGAGTNGLAATNVWNPTWVGELAPYSTLRFMDWGNTNWSKIVSWSQRRLPTDPGNRSTYIDASSAANNPGIAYEWMIDLGNRTQKDIWICVPAQTDVTYWTELAKLLKSKLQPGRKVYIEYSNETWNGSFGQFQYTINQGVAQRLPGDNQWYKGQAFAMLQSVKIFKVFQDVFGAAAMGTRVVRVFAYGGNMDTGRAALRSVYKSATYNPAGAKIDMLAIAPYVGSELDGAATDIATRYHREVDSQFAASGMVTFAVQDLRTFGIPSLGAYEGGQHLLKNSRAWSTNSKIYSEYMYMLDRYSDHFKLFMHYAHTSTWTNTAGQSSWGAKERTGQPLAEAHKYRAIVDWVNESK